MGICFGSLFLIVSGIVLMISMLRWFEQTRDAVDERNWPRVMLLVVAPPAVWLFRSRVSAGRPTAIPKYEPVRGFGALPKGGIVDPTTDASALTSVSAQPAPPPLAAISAQPIRAEDGPALVPPPGTPAEFMGRPKIPPKKPVRVVDPEKLAKLKQKMEEQGMLGDD